MEVLDITDRLAKHIEAETEEKYNSQNIYKVIRSVLSEENLKRFNPILEKVKISVEATLAKNSYEEHELYHLTRLRRLR